MRILTTILLIACLGAVNPIFANETVYNKQLNLAYEAAGKEEYQKAVDLLLSAIPKVPRDSVDTLCDIYSHLSIDYLRLSNFDEALKYGKMCLELDEKSGNEENISISLNNLAGICLTVKRYTLAEEYLKKGIEIEKRLGREDKLAVRLGMLCEVYTKTKRFDEATELAQQALALDRKGGREDKVAIRLSQLGSALTLNKQWSKAEPCLEEAYTLLQKYDNNASLCITTLFLGMSKLGLGKLNEAEKMLTQSLEIANKTGQREKRMGAFRELSRLYAKKNDFTKASRYLDAYITLNDSLQTETVNQQISDLQVRYETGQKELQLARQETVIQRQQLIAIGVSMLVVILLIALIFVYNSLRLKKRTLRLRDELMRIISHDLKNPALANQHSLHLLNKYSGSMKQEELNEELRQLCESADAQVGLLYNLLTWAQLQTDRLQYKPISMDLNSIVEEVVMQHSSQAAVKDITLKTETSPSAIVTADRQMACTILRNLLSNAIKFSPKGSTIEIITSGCTLTVNDHGVGMDNDTASTIGTAGESGTGVGMGLVRTLVKKNKATLTIESHINKGTRVDVTFPKAANE